MSETSGTPAFGSPQDTTPADWEQLDTPSAAGEGQVLEDSNQPTPAASGDDPVVVTDGVPLVPTDRPPLPELGTLVDDDGGRERVSSRVRPRAESSTSPESEKSGDSGRLPGDRRVVVAKRRTPRKAMEASSTTGEDEPSGAEGGAQGQGPAVSELYPTLGPDQGEYEDEHRIEVERPRENPRGIEEELERLRGPAERLRWLVHLWRKSLGLAALAPLPRMAAPGTPLTALRVPKPSVLRRAAPAIWLVLYTVLGLVGLGLLWVRCQRVYLDRLNPQDYHHHNVTMEYMCEHSFVWTYLLPRLIYLLGYLAVFVCWHCLKHPDLGRVVAEVYDTVTDQQEYEAVSNKFLSCCKWDVRRFIGLYVLVIASGAVENLIDNGVVFPEPVSFHRAIIVASKVTDLVFRQVLDIMIVMVLASYSLSLKYLSLLLLKVQTHLGNLSEQAHISSDCYIRQQYTRGHKLMHASQAGVSAVLLLVLLRVSQGVARIVLDLTNGSWRLRSLCCLPAILVQASVAIYYIYRCCRLSEEGHTHHMRHVSTGPDFATGGTPETEEVTDDDTAPLAAQPGTSAEPAGHPERTRQQWDAALQSCPMVDGRMFGLAATRWMLALSVLVLAAYCAVIYVLERFWPLF